MFYQIYKIHLIDGNCIDYWEDYDLPWDKGLISKFEKADDNEMFTIRTFLTNRAYIPKKSIVCITTGDVRETWEKKAASYGSKNK